MVSKNKSENLILLHGFCESKEMWSDFESDLSKDYNVYCLDLPGFGDFHFDVSDLSIEEIAQIIQNEINNFHLDEYVIVGHSLGGYVALEIAKQFPHKLKGLGLFHSTAFADSEERKEKRDDVIHFIEKHGGEVFGKSFIPQLFYKEKRVECEDDINKITKIAINTSDRTLIEVTKAMQTRNNNIELLKELNVPILFIIGKHDSSVSLSDSLKQISLPKNTVVNMLENCGHMGMFEQKNKTLIQIRNFVEYCHS